MHFHALLATIAVVLAFVLLPVLVIAGICGVGMRSRSRLVWEKVSREILSWPHQRLISKPSGRGGAGAASTRDAGPSTPQLVQMTRGEVGVKTPIFHSKPPPSSKLTRRKNFAATPKENHRAEMALMNRKKKDSPKTCETPSPEIPSVVQVLQAKGSHRRRLLQKRKVLLLGRSRKAESESDATKRAINMLRKVR